MDESYLDIIAAARQSVRALTRCDADAEDLAHEAFVTIWPRHAELGEDFPRVVCGAARKLGLRVLRKRRSEDVLPLGADDQGVPSAELSTRRREGRLVSKMDRFIEKLTEVEQQTLSLWRGGDSVSTIATKRCESRGTIASRIFRALNKLRIIGATA